VTVISVVIPALDEEQTVGGVVRGVREALDVIGPAGSAPEVIVVDGGSRDQTFREAEAAGATVLVSPGMGKGLAVRAGLAAAAGDTIVLLDSDGQDVPGDLPKLVDAYTRSGADFVNGSRFLGTFRDQGIAEVDYWGNRALTGLANVLCRTKLSDINASFRVLRRSALEPIAWRFSEFEVESEMILKAARSGLNIVEVPVVRERRLGGKRKFRKVRHGLRILATIVRVSLLWRPPESRNILNKNEISGETP